jgi:hypothetical protein
MVSTAASAPLPFHLRATSARGCVLQRIHTATACNTHTHTHTHTFTFTLPSVDVCAREMRTTALCVLFDVCCRPCTHPTDPHGTRSLGGSGGNRAHMMDEYVGVISAPRVSLLCILSLAFSPIRHLHTQRRDTRRVTRVVSQGNVWATFIESTLLLNCRFRFRKRRVPRPIRHADALPRHGQSLKPCRM